MFFEIYQQQRGLALMGAHTDEWRWRLKADNGEILAQGESYASQQNLRHAIALLKQTNAVTPVRDARQIPRS